MGAKPLSPAILDPTNPPASWEGSTGAERVRYMLYGPKFKRDREHFSRASGLPRSVIAAIDRGEREPTREELRQIAVRCPAYSSGWVKTGQGMPMIPGGAVLQIAATPAPEAEVLPASAGKAENPPACPIAERVKVMLSEIWMGNPGRMALETGLGRENLTAILNGATPDDDALEKIAAAAPVINLDWLLAGRGSMLMPPAQPAKAEAAPEAIPRPANPPPASLDSLIELIEMVRTFGAEARGIREQLDSLGQRVAKIEDDDTRLMVGDIWGKLSARVDQAEDKLVGLIGMDATVSSLETELAGTNSRLAQVEGTVAGLMLAKVPKAFVPTSRIESQVPAEAAMTVGKWCELEGPHQRLIRDEADRRTMGKRLARVYRIQDTDQMNFSGSSLLFRVSDMRLYVEWLSRAGLEPDPEAWVAHYLAQRSKP